MSLFREWCIQVGLLLQLSNNVGEKVDCMLHVEQLDKSGSRVHTCESLKTYLPVSAIAFALCDGLRGKDSKSLVGWLSLG